MSEEGARRELILYATPEGPLARACAAFFADLVERDRQTTAQTYPPHVTLTGFFRRRSVAVDRVVAEARRVISASPRGEADVSNVTERPDWVGLEITSEWMLSVAAAFTDLHELEAGDDPLRLKTWLHLSLAYGDVPGGRELAEYADVARRTIDADLRASWSIGLWERADVGWIRHC